MTGMRRIGIVDYGLGNLFNVAKAFAHQGIPSFISDKGGELLAADALVLPGVGAFQDCMEGMVRRELVQLVKDFVKSGKPLLGICVGMQMLMEASHEMGYYKGLGLIEGDVVTFEQGCSVPVKVPNIGWNSIHIRRGNDVVQVFRDVADEAMFYFVHSFFPVPARTENVLAESRHGDQIFACAVVKDNVVGCQFHPEKSGRIGLDFLKAFATKSE